MKTDLFQSCGHCWVFQICWHIECSTLTVSSFRTWNSSAGIPPPPLALFIVMLLKAHLTSDSRISGSRWVITPLWLSGSKSREHVFLICCLEWCLAWLGKVSQMIKCAKYCWICRYRIKIWFLFSRHLSLVGEGSQDVLKTNGNNIYNTYWGSLWRETVVRAGPQSMSKSHLGERSGVISSPFKL